MSLPNNKHDAGTIQSQPQSISIDLPSTGDGARPSNLRYVSQPAYESPLRHHRRKASSHKEVKETLHARSEYTNSEDDGGSIHRINQYMIKQEIGRGSFGAVHLAVDQNGTEYAVKEFSKSRLRKRAQSNILRRPHAGRGVGHIAAGLGLNSPLHRHPTGEASGQEDGGNPLFFIKEEIAVMKKLDHGNLVSLIEVLDDPHEDSLYMVLEMCKKGVIMKVGLDERADPYDDESCRCWFRDLILGIEYLHAQGIVHRDIKPDNLLLTEDDVLKVVDFGVSEIFEKQSEMMTAKSAGSPAFLPPELCVAKHGDISGKAADIWSMGVTLYCLRFGKIPFEQPGVLQLYESIKHDTIDFDTGSDVSGSFKDLMNRLLEKDPQKRIKMRELRIHPWVTKEGKDPLLSEDENIANLIEPPTEEETNEAITGNLSNIVVLMKAVKKFKSTISRKRPSGLDSILGKDNRIVQPPLPIKESYKPPPFHKTRSQDIFDRKPLEQALAAEGIHRAIDIESLEQSIPNRQDTAVNYSPRKRSTKDDPTEAPYKPGNSKRVLNASPKDHRPPSHAATAPASIDHPGKGQAHDPLSDHLYLALGTGGRSAPPSPPAVSESPPAADMDIYELAYHNELERIRARQGKSATLFLTRRVEGKDRFKDDEDLIRGEPVGLKSSSGLTKVLEQARLKAAGVDKVRSGSDDEVMNDEP